MSVAGGELRAAVAGAADALGRRIRLLGFDACLMGMVEVAAEVRSSCDYFVASEGLVPWGGLPYEALAGLLFANPAAAPQSWLPALCSTYVAEYPSDDVCMSAVDLRRLDAVLARGEMAGAVNAAGAGARGARLGCQTFPTEDRPPSAADDQIDLGDFLRRAPGGAAAALALESCVVANAASNGLDGARGLAGWFPDRYLAFKSDVGLYQELEFAAQSGWPGFLNRYFGLDDVKPSRPDISRIDASGSAVRLWWGRSTDLAPVRYRVYRARDEELVAGDSCESMAGWRTVGWSVSSRSPHSGSGCFASGSGANRRDTLELTGLNGVRLVEFWARFHTLEDEDTSGVSHDVCYVECLVGGEWRRIDSLFGRQDSWLLCRYFVPDAEGLRLCYETGTAVGSSSIFVDDVRLRGLSGLQAATPELADTTALLYGLARNPDGYRFYVTARDSFGNVSMVSEPAWNGSVLDYAEPYTVPAPFADSCRIVIDGPGGQYDVTVFTLSGARVRRFAGVGSSVSWDGCNESGRPVAAGVYLVVAEQPGFRRIGRIAKSGR
jgi:hypothetical protein